MNNFRVGQKVVCIDMDRLPSIAFKQVALPKVGSVYTIRDIGRTWVRLEEFVYPQMYGELDGVFDTSEPAFKTHRFRPLIERKTDISIFTEMLKPKQKELVTD